VGTADGPPSLGRETAHMRVSFKRILASLGSLAFLLMAAGAEWKL
jgi:hypothetical protein